MFLNWMLQSKEFNPKNFNTSAITLKLGFKLGFKTRASRGNHGNLTHQGPRGNMHKLFGCISTPLKRFLACLTFHTEEIRLRHLHKRTNTGAAPDIYIYICIYNLGIIQFTERVFFLALGTALSVSSLLHCFLPETSFVLDL